MRNKVKKTAWIVRSKVKMKTQVKYKVKSKKEDVRPWLVNYIKNSQQKQFSLVWLGFLAYQPL